ncbi:hypothetical protein PTXU04_00051 [Escherichia phage PTXU04]|uniref:Uncharacterized protein n=1 Tax=Escherichia phage PTXU04 TaxID=2508206 RepID=A0A482MSJ6_9CAUD|nr:hypothetical protein HOV50_gp51 [Escherichia phage PTXU04]QBQ76665.1 hypothetical protein PTXU04_00051 [Escherichia phage PTXU04]
MKTITLTFNEALVLIAEGMTMNNVKSLANKLRNADAPAPVIYPSNDAYNDALKQVEILKQNLKSLNQQVYDYERALEKAKQTETTLRDELRNSGERNTRLCRRVEDLENDAKQDDESLKYFRKWVEGLRVATDADKGLATAGVFSQAIEMIKESNRLGDRVVDLESKLNKANDVIATVKAAYDADDFNDDKISLITSAVEAYYRGN